MELVELADVNLTYLMLAAVDYGADIQYYGTLEGSLTGERLMGTLSLTNLAPGRSDNVDQSTVRGLPTTPDGTKLWVELDGMRVRASAHAAIGERTLTAGEVQMAIHLRKVLGHVDPTPRTIDYTPAVTHVPQSSYNNRPTPSASTPGTNSNSDQV